MCIESFHRSEELRPEAKNFKTFFVHTVKIFNLPDIYSVLIFSISQILILKIVRMKLIDPFSYSSSPKQAVLQKFIQMHTRSNCDIKLKHFFICRKLFIYICA